jgi:hypothetical protein
MDEPQPESDNWVDKVKDFDNKPVTGTDEPSKDEIQSYSKIDAQKKEED